MVFSLLARDDDYYSEGAKVLTQQRSPASPNGTILSINLLLIGLVCALQT